MTAAKSLNNLFKGEATGTNRVAPILDICGGSDPRIGVELDLAHHLLEEETEQFLYRNALTRKYIPVAKNNNSIGDPSDSDGADVDSAEDQCRVLPYVQHERCQKWPKQAKLSVSCFGF